MSTSTQISNLTKHIMKLRVGSARYASDLASVEAGGKYKIGVDVNATYREYILQVDAAGLANIIVSSDDLCDYKCITIKEENGKLNVEKDPRHSETAPVDPPGKTSKKSKWIPAWMQRSERKIVQICSVF